MKSDGPNSIRKYGVMFDSTTNPILTEVLSILRLDTIRNCFTLGIYNRLCGREIHNHGTFSRNMPNTGKMPNEFNAGNAEADYIKQVQILINDLYNIEGIFRKDQAQTDSELQNADDAVNHMPNIVGIRDIKETLSENIQFLREHCETFKSADIFVNIEGKRERIRCTDIESFKKEFFKYARAGLRPGNIPDFELDYSRFGYLVKEIQRVANFISGNFKAGSFSARDVGQMLKDVYLLAYYFELFYYQLFDKDIIAGSKVHKAVSIAAKQTNERKQKHYPWLKEIAITMVKAHPNYSITRAAQELKKVWDKKSFGISEKNKSTNQNLEKTLTISTKTIKDVICKLELAPLNKTKKIRK